MICPACQAANDDSLAACGHCGAALGAPTAFVVAIDLKPGAILDERYEIQKALGRGGMGMVYRARDRSLDETVAIKVLRPDFAQDPKMAERFRSEIKLARRVRHKNVCTIHDYGEAQGLLYISMELIEGKDLKHVLRERGAFSGAAAYDLALQVAEGLQAVHDAGIIHRDLKTPNIMLDDKGVARLLDFGIARRQEGGSVASTATGHVLGTPEYMSPEQAHGRKVDHRTDIYALGILIYEIFTGQVPFQGDTPISTILKHLHEAPPLETGGIPPALQPVLRRALAKEPEARYPSTRALADALREARDFVSDSPTLSAATLVDKMLTAPAVTAPPPRRPPLVPTRPRRKALQPWLLVVPVALAGGVLVLTTRISSPPAMPVPAVRSEPPTTAPAMTMAPKPETPPPTTVATTLRPTPTTTLVRRASPSPSPALPASAAPIAAVPPATTPPTTTPPTPRPSEAPTEPGQLQLAVRPWAEVSVDGRVVGTTPLDRISLPAGPHLISLRHPGYEELRRTVTLRSGETAKLVVDLAKEGMPKRP